MIGGSKGILASSPITVEREAEDCLGGNVISGGSRMVRGVVAGGEVVLLLRWVLLCNANR